ncbi:hypothetical protein V5799_014870 [Amblyomma americanum]|uniref:Uncharacterized protein n=1 Tax=Amblyomma americanum TaxID=6943 RepID=A0AAQ4E1S5_AMBAM
MAEKRQPPVQNAAKIQEENGVVKSLREDENEKLKRRIAEQDATIKEINEKLTTLIAMQQQQQLPPKPAQERKQEEITEDEPEVEVDPRATKAAGPAPKRRAIEGAKERMITERIEKQDDRLYRLEATSEVTNERLTALAQTVSQMTTNIQSTVQNMMPQMQAQLQTQMQAKIQGRRTARRLRQHRHKEASHYGRGRLSKGATRGATGHYGHRAMGGQRR